MNSVKEDEKDRDVDVRVRIRPNALERLASISFEMGTDEEGFQKALLDAFKIVAENNFEQSASGQVQQDNTFATNQEQKELIQKSSEIHNKIIEVQNRYKTSKDASDLSQASFKVGSLSLAVFSGHNNYIMPVQDSDVASKTHYSFGTNGLDNKKISINKSLTSLKKNQKAMSVIAVEITGMEDLLKEVNNIMGIDKMDKSKQFISDLVNIYSTMCSKSNNAPYLSELEGIFSAYQNIRLYTDFKMTRKYAYHTTPPTVTAAKKLYEGFEESINELSHTTFVAALIAEPSRNSVAHISNMLSLDKRSELNDTTLAAPKDESYKEKENYKSSLIYEHLSMTQDGSQKNPDGKSVTNRHLRSIQVNPDLTKALKVAYQKDKNDLKTMAKLMSDYLGVN